ncbi:programmed cell death protein 5 isoform X1 [Desmodus rotundus]|nr:programmed cell death protein 5 isoform X1 [Desmodus rotundus]
MAEEELEALRKQRLAELQAKQGDPGDAAQQEAKHREAEMRNSILAQVLDQSARARLSNLALVKPEKTKGVENYLIQMARYGQLSGKGLKGRGGVSLSLIQQRGVGGHLRLLVVVTEQGLIEILEKVSQQTEKKTTVKFNRRKVMDSDEDDDY